MNLIAIKIADKAFISNGFTNWQDAGTKNRGFDKHFRSDTYREPHEWPFTIPDVCGDTSAQLSTTFNEAKSVNRQNLLKILSNVKLLPRQALPLKGDESEENSNFFQLYILWEKDNEGLKASRTEKKINKYVHSTTENEIMQTMALRVLWKVAENIQDVDFDSIMCNKTTDVKNVSELVVCLRWVDDELQAHDEFIGLNNMPNTDADSVVREFKDVLPQMHLKLNKCRGQCYDRCSTMSGSKSRVAVQIKSEKERALYTHCYAHSINLAVGDMMTVWLVVKETINNTYELTKLVKIILNVMLNSTPFKWSITLVAAMKIASLLMDLKPHHKIVLSYPMDRLYRLSQWSYQKLWWVAKVVKLTARKLFLFGDEITYPWHQSVYTQIFLLLRDTFSSLDSFSYQQSQSNVTG